MKRFKSLQGIGESTKVILSGHSMTADIGAHTCVATSNSLSSVNTVSIFITQNDDARAKEAIVAATIIIRDMLEGE